MKFRYEFDPKKLPQPITHHDRIMLMGSCFTENIGEKLDRYKFTTLQNPNGILFNPVSVTEALTDYVEAREFTETDLFHLNEAWHSWKHHSRFSGVSKEDALAKINASVKAAHKFLQQADYVILTLGSAWIYTLTDKAANAKPGAVAANNHKAPADWFHRRLMKPPEVLQILGDVVECLLKFNPSLKFIFTISPVRHLREGVVENNRSKAVLIQAVHELVEKSDRLFYFPAYELVIDDLRDYRYYAEDLVHPNYFATQYVWEKMIASCMDEKTKALIEELQAVYLAFHHKAFNPSSTQHQKFLQSFCQKTMALQEQHPYLNLKDEIAYFSQGQSAQ